MQLSALELAQKVVAILDDKKAQQIKLLKVADVTVLSEYFVLCNGTSTTQIKALAGEVEGKLKEEQGIMPLRTEGYQAGNWVVLDYGSVIVHVFHTEMRDFYQLERLWADAQDIDVKSFLSGAAADEK